METRTIASRAGLALLLGGAMACHGCSTRPRADGPSEKASASALATDTPPVPAGPPPAACSVALSRLSRVQPAAGATIELPNGCLPSVKADAGWVSLAADAHSIAIASNGDAKPRSTTIVAGARKI